jgi:conjugative relaxase-like TrwC/TraI family protein
VLSIGKIGKSEEQQKYYEESVAKSREDYYAGKGEAPGEFFGTGARALGLAGESNMEALQRLFAGQHPATGEQLRSMKGNVQVHGLDLTFSAPKSVSVLYAVGDAGVQENLVAAHEWAVEQAIGYMEREGARVVRGHKASKKDRALGIEDTLETHRAGGFVGIRYRHRVNRLQDPQLHTHYVIGNWALGPDGRYTALAAEHIYDLAKSGGAVYQMILRSKVRELEPWVEWGEVENGLAEFSPELMNPEMLRAFSMRTQDVDNFIANPYAFIRNPERAREAELAMAGMSARARRQYATLRTRASKITGEIDQQSWRTDVLARAAEWDLTPETIAAYRDMEAFEDTAGFDVASVQEHAFGPNGVTANQNTFERKDVVIEVANAAQQGVGTWLADVDAYVAEVEASDQVVYVRTDKLRERKTTREYIACEQDLIDAAVHGLAANRAVLDSESIDRGLAHFYATHPEIDPKRFVQQESVVRAVATDGHAISSIEALAGSGKTTTAGAMRNVFEGAGYRTFATGPTGRAVRELAAVGFERPRTLSAWEVKFEIMGAPQAIRSTMGDPSKAILFVDETGMADTRLLSKIVTQMSDAGVKVVPIGDSYQLTSVRAGGMHAALSRQIGAYELTTVRRQNNLAEIDALEQLRHGNAMAYIEYKRGRKIEITLDGEEQGKLVGWAPRDDEDFAGRSDMEIFTGDDANTNGMARAVADFMEMRDRGIAAQQEAALTGKGTPFAHARGMHDIALITKDNARRTALNEMIRERLAELGVLTGHRTMGSFQGEELEWAVGDRVIARLNSRGYNLDNGTLGTIVELDETGMTLSDDNGNERRFNVESADDLKYVSEHLEHAYALTAHGTQGATLRWTGVVGLPSEFSREWAYTALSRAKQLTKIYLVSGYTPAEEARKDFATVMEAETDPDKIVGRLATRMEKRDLEEAALLQRSRDGLLNIGAQDDALGEDAEFLVDAETYRDTKYRLAGAAFERMRGTAAIGGERLETYADLLAYRSTVLSANGSERMQDAIGAAEDWQRFGEMIEDVYVTAGDNPLTSDQLQAIDTFTGVRDDITARYPDPQAILNIEGQRIATLARIDRDLVVAREAAISEHRAAKPDWLTVVGSRPAGRKLYDVWTEVVDGLAGQYVDARANVEAEQMLASATERGADAAASATEERVDPLTIARAEAKRAYDAYLADPDDGALLQGAISAQRGAEDAELDSRPDWLTATLGDRPGDARLAEQWDALGRKLIGVRRANDITSEVDNGYAHADALLRQSIGRFRLQSGLEQARGTDTGFGIGD